MKAVVIKRPITDMLDREIHVDDFVVFYSNIYRVLELGKHCNQSGNGEVKLLIWDGGKTSRPVRKYSKDIAILDKNDVLLWLLKKGK